jgi:hypothetical protein
MNYFLLKSISGCDNSVGIDINSLYEIFIKSNKSCTINQLNKESTQNIVWSCDDSDLLPLDSDRYNDPEYIAEIIKSLPQPTIDIFNSCEQIREHSQDIWDDILLLYAQTKYEKLSNTIIENKVVLEENNPVTIVDYKKVITDYFGAERVSFSPTEFIVYFPEQTVTNSNGKQHTMYDIYLKIKLKHNNNIYRERLYKELIDSKYTFLITKSNPCFCLDVGTRTRVSPEEHNIGYMFSHLQAKKHGWSSSCLGQDVLATYRSTPIISEEHVMGFCMALEVYLSWESLELGPYVHISSIVPVRNRPVIHSANSQRMAIETIHSANSQRMAIETIKHLMVSQLDNSIENISNDFTIKLNKSKIDESNPYFKINGELFDKDKLLGLVNDSNDSKNVTYYGDNFFTFNGENKGRVSIDHSLSKTKKQSVLLGELLKYDDFYGYISSQMQTLLKQILTNDTTQYLEKKPTFNLASV